MSDYEPMASVHVTPPPSSGGALYFIVGALVVAVLAGAYFLVGMPGLQNSNLARAPDRTINVTVEQPRAPAPPATPAAPAAPAAPRQ